MTIASEKQWFQCARAQAAETIALLSLSRGPKPLLALDHSSKHWFARPFLAPRIRIGAPASDLSRPQQHWAGSRA